MPLDPVSPLTGAEIRIDLQAIFKAMLREQMECLKVPYLSDALPIVALALLDAFLYRPIRKHSQYTDAVHTNAIVPHMTKENRNNTLNKEIELEEHTERIYRYVIQKDTRDLHR